MDIPSVELKKIELEILDYIHDICETNQLRYYLAYGTLLGAVRHKGFIPWDDDIDIWMPREDYEKLQVLLREEKGRFIYLSCETRDDYFYQFAKVVDTTTTLQEIGYMPIKDYGVYIDIFPLDGRCSTLDGFLLRMLSVFRSAACNLNPSLNIKRKKNRILHTYLGKVLRLFTSSHKLAILLNRIAKRYDYKTAKEVNSTVCGDYVSRYINKEVFGDPSTILFENKEYCAPCNSDALLKFQYGPKYNELPPVEMRCSVHNFRAQYK